MAGTQLAVRRQAGGVMNRRQLFVTTLLGIVGVKLEPIKAQSGFILRSTLGLQHTGFFAGVASWGVAGLTLIATDPSLRARLRELEGKKIIITIEAD